MAISSKSFFSSPIPLIVIAGLAAVSCNLWLTCSLLGEGQPKQADPYADQAIEQPFHQEHNHAANEQSEAQGFLGIEIATVDARTIHSTGVITIVPGVLVVRTLPDFNAYASGFSQNDIITHIDGVRVTDSSQVSRFVAHTQPGTRISVSVIRDGQPLVLYPTVGAKPAALQKLQEERAAQIERCRAMAVARE